MRYIDIHQIAADIPSAWEEKARRRLDDLRNLPSSERRRKLTTLQSFQIWGEVKDILGNASGQKCWYCETKRNRDSFAVDHFRPKNATKVLNPSSGTQQTVLDEGYWWLTYEWRNYRFSCNYCNSGCVTDGTAGKNDLFPLVDENTRVKLEPSCFEDHENETPLLLDPTNQNDVKLIVFDRDGHVHPRFKSDHEAEQEGYVQGHTRARFSIEVYGLDGKTITRAKKDLIQDILATVAILDTNMETNANDLEKGTALIAQATIKLLRSTDPNAEYCSTARSVVNLLCINRTWLKGIMKQVEAGYVNV